MKFKGFIFDADGVIIPLDFYLDRLAETHNVPIKNILKLFEDHTWEPVVTGKKDLKEVLPAFMEEWGWKGTVEELLDRWFSHEGKTDPRIVVLIESLKAQGYKCFLATNQEQYRLDYLYKQMGFSEIFHGTYGSAQIGYRKPSVEFYEHVLEDIESKYGLKREELLFIDDTASNITAAEAVGLPSFLYKEFEALEQFLNT